MEIVDFAAPNDPIIFWLIMALHVIAVVGIGYYLRICFTLLSVACQMLQTLAFHSNQISQKISGLITGDNHGKDLHELIEEEKDILARIEVSLADSVSASNGETGAAGDLASLIKQLQMSVDELRGLAYNTYAIRQDMQMLVDHMCPPELKQAHDEELDADRSALNKAIDKIEKSQTKDLGALEVDDYRALLHEHMPLTLLEDLELFDRRIHRFRAKYHK